jgi:hypothetical protein
MTDQGLQVVVTKKKNSMQPLPQYRLTDKSILTTSSKKGAQVSISLLG